MSYYISDCDSCSCLDVDAPVCAHLAFITNLFNTDIIVSITDYQNRNWQITTTTNSDGLFVIDTDIFPSGLLIPETGIFSVKAFQVGVMPSQGRVKFTGGDFNYYCINLTFRDTRTLNFDYDNPYYIDTDTFLCCCSTCNNNCNEISNCSNTVDLG